MKRSVFLVAGTMAVASLFAATSEPAPNSGEAPPNKLPMDPGSIVVPPKTDSSAVKTPPLNIDPGIAKSPDAATTLKPAAEPKAKRPNKRKRDGKKEQ